MHCRIGNPAYAIGTDTRVRDPATTVSGGAHVHGAAFASSVDPRVRDPVSTNGVDGRVHNPVSTIRVGSMSSGKVRATRRLSL